MKFLVSVIYKFDDDYYCGFYLDNSSYNDWFIMEDNLTEDLLISHYLEILE